MSSSAAGGGGGKNKDGEETKIEGQDQQQFNHPTITPTIQQITEGTTWCDKMPPMYHNLKVSMNRLIQP